MEGEAMIGFVVGFVIALVFGAALGSNSGREQSMETVHATLEPRCVESEVYSRDLLACVITRQGR